MLRFDLRVKELFHSNGQWLLSPPETIRPSGQLCLGHISGHPAIVAMVSDALLPSGKTFGLGKGGNVGLKILEILALWQGGLCDLVNCRHHTSNEGVPTTCLHHERPNISNGGSEMGESKMVRISSSCNDRKARGNISTPIVSNFRLRRGGRMNAAGAVTFDRGQHC